MKKLTLEEMELQVLKEIHSLKNFTTCISLQAGVNSPNRKSFSVFFDDNSERYKTVFLYESEDEEVKKRKLDIIINAIRGDEEALNTILEGKC